MNRCRRIRAWIVRSVDGDLTPVEALRLARHLGACTACRIVLARETRLATVLENVGDAFGVDESFFRAVMDSLPEQPVRPTLAASRRARLRRGLRLALFAMVSLCCAGVGGQWLPSLRLDIAAPAMPRFSPDDTAGWISLIGSAATWIRLTAQSIGWAGSSGELGALSIGAVFLGAGVAGVAALLALSGAIAWTTRTNASAS